MSRFGLFLFIVAVAMVAVWMPELAWAGPTPTPSPDPCAGQLFCLPVGDVSIQWLKATFPELVQISAPTTPSTPTPAPTPTATGPSTILAQALMVMNSGALAVGSLLLTYKLFAGIVQTANDGEVLGKRWSTLWGPVRVAASAALIVPTASGYCLAQAAVVAITMLGIGLANSVWSRIVDGMLKGQGMIAPVPHAHHEAVAREVFKRNLCLHLANYYFIHKIAEARRTEPSATLGDTLASSRGPTYNNWYWTGRRNTNIYAVGDPVAGANANAAFPNGSLFYRDARWVNNIPSGSFDSERLTNWEITQRATLSWDSVDVDKGWFLNLFNWGFDDDACGTMYVEGIDIGNGPTSTWRDWLRRSFGGQTEEERMQESIQAMGQQVGRVHGSALQQLAADLDEPSKLLAARIVDSYLSPARRECVDNIAECIANATFTEENGALIANAAISYGERVRNNLQWYIGTVFSSEDSIVQAYRGLAKDGGWATAGEWYLNIMKMNSMMQRLVEVRVNHGRDASIWRVCLGVDGCQRGRSGDMFREAVRQVRNSYDEALTAYSRAGMTTGDAQARAATLARITGAFGTAAGEQEGRSVIGTIAKIGVTIRLAYMGIVDQDLGSLAGVAMMGIDMLDAEALVGSASASVGSWLLDTTGLELNTDGANPIARVIALGRTLWSYGLVITFALDDGEYSGADRAQMAIFTSDNFAESEVAAQIAAEASDLGIGGLMRTVGQLMLIPGFLLGYLFPFLPWLLWIGGLVGWFILVLEAVIAAPLWALAHMRMDGEGIMGPAGQQGYMLALSLMLRPSLMLIGMICGMVMIYVLVPFVGVSLISTFELGRTSGARVDMMGQVMMIALLAFVTVTIAYKAFGLINQIPDRVLRWIGSGSGGAGEDEFRTGAMAIINTGAIGSIAGAAAGDKSGGEGGGGGGGGGEGGASSEGRNKTIVGGVRDMLSN